MLSKLKHLFLQGENETLFSYFFRLTDFVNLGLSVLYSLFIMFLTTFYDSYVFFILFPTTFFLSLFITGAFGAIQSAKLSTLYQKYQNASVDLFKSDMILLVKLLSKFPAKFSCLTYIYYLTAGIISIAVLSYMMILPFMTFAILWIFIIIFPALLILRLTQTICSKRTENIISTYFKNDFSISSVSKKGYLGLSVKTQYILYVFLPFLCVCLASSIILFYFSSSLDTINLIKLSISIAIGLIFCTVPSFLTVFFIKKSNSFLQKQIDYIESKK